MFYSGTGEIFSSHLAIAFTFVLGAVAKGFFFGICRRSVWVKKSNGMMNHQHYRQSWGGRARRSGSSGMNSVFKNTKGLENPSKKIEVDRFLSIGIFKA